MEERAKLLIENVEAMFQPLEPDQKAIHEKHIKDFTNNRQDFFELIFWCF